MTDLTLSHVLCKNGSTAAERSSGCAGHRGCGVASDPRAAAGAATWRTAPSPRCSRCTRCAAQEGAGSGSDLWLQVILSIMVQGPAVRCRVEGHCQVVAGVRRV